MHITKPIITFSSLLLPTTTLARNALYVETAPDDVRPYIIEHYAPAQAVSVGQQVYRFPVTGPSSGGAFSLLSTASPSSPALGVLPHHHRIHHENFFCLKGGFQLWADPAINVNGTNPDQQARLLMSGDYGSVPRNTTHTFQILEPDTEMVGVIAPGGFEDLFFFLADSNFTSETWTPYAPASPDGGDGSAGGSPPPEVISALQQFDVYAELDTVPRRDLVNGSAPSGSGWHVNENEIPSTNSTPWFVAKDYGPKWLNRGSEGVYQIVQPFVTRESGGGEFTQGSITISRQPPNSAPASHTSPHHTAIEVLEGALTLTISGGGEQPATLIMGDVAFIPENTSFSYWSDVAFTKFMYVSGGAEGLDKELMEGENVEEGWGWPVFPVE